MLHSSLLLAPLARATAGAYVAAQQIDLQLGTGDRYDYLKDHF